MALSAAAGPISNLLLAVVFALLLKVYITFYSVVPLMGAASDTIIYLVYVFLVLGIRLNVTLAVFNLIPVPPFDGSRVAYVFLPPKYYFAVMKYEQYIYIGLMLLLLLGVLDPILNFVSGNIMNLLFLAVGL